MQLAMIALSVLGIVGLYTVFATVYKHRVVRYSEEDMVVSEEWLKHPRYDKEGYRQ